ncbi:DNA-3-methyladenine glycosylase 2 family protein [Actinoplanes sp. TBRC 11911]|uniref:DNA-3-methyladenine glycosylase family protein n=1 Tax=Actinoplanes sp. TBRC 11911 TaxID=2729386 RepID=UPI00145CBDCF|nr:DNA-3-methyladenine glycosylase 2 family protein [Actinoplanes sp. TBRC 11911]NMO51318.1 DNA-3-methyladenine glycosylase 2 family protein [Actinoplanes sp. TBRC 11911]
MENTVLREVVGPWSLATSRAFWEGFAPAALGDQRDAELRTVFRVDADWSRAAVAVRQEGARARITVSGDGDLDAAAAQTARFLSLDVDARGWAAVGARDPVIGGAQAELPGLRPCGFHSPYEAAVWAVLCQRIRITQAARLREGLMADGVLPEPARLRGAELDLPGRKPEFLRAVADAALDGVLDGESLRWLDPDAAVERVRTVKGLGPFAAELVVLRGANHPDGLPQHERRLDAEVAERYGGGTTLGDVAEAWRPFRTWAAVHLRILRERRTGEIGGPAS